MLDDIAWPLRRDHTHWKMKWNESLGNMRWIWRNQSKGRSRIEIEKALKITLGYFRHIFLKWGFSFQMSARHDPQCPVEDCNGKYFWARGCFGVKWIDEGMRRSRVECGLACRTMTAGGGLLQGEVCCRVAAGDSWKGHRGQVWLSSSAGTS